MNVDFDLRPVLNSAIFTISSVITWDIIIPETLFFIETADRIKKLKFESVRSDGASLVVDIKNESNIFLVAKG